jgi:twinkle protein
MKQFSDFGIMIPPGRGGEIKVVCPQCSPNRKKQNYPCLNVNVEDGVWHCWHCDWSGTLKQGVWRKAQIKPVFSKPVLKKEPVKDNWRKWLNGRGISDKTIEANELSCEVVYMPQIEAETEAICFPFIRRGEVVNAKYRDLKKNFRMVAGAERVLYGLDDIDPAFALIWVEGEIDKLSLFEVGFEACVSVPDGAPAVESKSYSNKFSFLEADEEKIKSVKQHIIAVDNDEPGKKLRSELVRRLGAENCFVVTWPKGCKDANEVLVKHGAEALQNAIATAAPVPVEGVFYVADAYDSLVELYNQGEIGGYKTGVKLIDDLFTVRLGDFTVVTGVPSHGKSNMLDFIMLLLAKNSGLKTAFCSPENQPIQLHIKKMAEKWLEKPFFSSFNGYPRMTMQELNSACADLSEYVSFILPEQPTIDKILDAARIEVYRRGIHALVIDPWNELEHSRPSGQTESEYIGDSLRKMRKFAREHNIHLFIVAHPTKMSQDDNGRPDIPTPYSISGSANWRNKADNCLCVYRNTDSVDLHVQKIRVKEVGKIGSARLKYIDATGGYEA